MSTPADGGVRGTRYRSSYGLIGWGPGGSGAAANLAWIHNFQRVYCYRVQREDGKRTGLILGVSWSAVFPERRWSAGYGRLAMVN